MKALAMLKEDKVENFDLRHINYNTKVEEKLIDELKSLFEEEKIKIDDKQREHNKGLRSCQKWKDTAIYRDKEGKKFLKQDLPYFLKMHAQECFPYFNETIKSHFKNQPEAKEWYVKNEYQSNINRLRNRIDQ